MVHSGLAVTALLVAVAWPSAQSPPVADDPTPQSIEQFHAAVERVLQETGVAGAGIALLRQDRVEWEGGVGLADRAQRTPVTADTHFRVGSISKTFVALALVQLSEDGLVDLEHTVETLAPEVTIENPWNATHPVRVIHLLEHTAGFDDMHFNEWYNLNESMVPALDVLNHNPASRRVRWSPGSRTAYSNPGYAVAGYLIEKITGHPPEQYIDREIFKPLGMTTTSFALTANNERLLATGYYGLESGPVGYPRIYLRSAGDMHSSARELGRFVRMLLNWGELGDAFIVDPEYLGNMEQPRTTLAAAAGLRNGYGKGIATILDLPYVVLGKGGSIDGFMCSYGYSPSRDVGFVVLLNSDRPRAGETLQRLMSLAIRYLKRDVEPPSRPEAQIDRATLDQYVGYYHDANPRNQIAWAVQSLMSGLSIEHDGTSLFADPVFGRGVRLIPVSETLFRLEDEIDASRVFTHDESGTMILAGTDVYAERQPRWRVEMVRVPILAAIATIISVLAVAVIWVARFGRAVPHGFWILKLTLLSCPVALIAPIAALALTPPNVWGTRNGGTSTVLVASLALPVLAALAGALSLAAYHSGASRWLVLYAVLVAAATAGLSVYLAAHDLLGLRLWSY